MPYKNAEKRKEKSRDAARSRRGKEADVFAELSDILPVAHETLASMDKASVMRIAISNVKLLTLLNHQSRLTNQRAAHDPMYDSEYLPALGGYLLVLDANADVVYVSADVTRLLGINQLELLGANLCDFTHPCDHDELREILSEKVSLTDDNSPVTHEHSFFMRHKCTLTSKGRNVNLKSATYKVIRYTGHHLMTSCRTSADGADVSETPLSAGCLVLIGEPIPQPTCTRDAPLDSHSFVTQHTCDMRFTHCDDRLHELLGYDSDDVIGQSLFDFHHAADSDVMHRAYRCLFSKGQMWSERYRLLARGGGYVWVESQASVLHNPRTDKAQSVVCVHHVLSGIEKRSCVMSHVQLGRGCASSLSSSRYTAIRPAPRSADNYRTSRKMAVVQPCQKQQTTMCVTAHAPSVDCKLQSQEYISEMPAILCGGSIFDRPIKQEIIDETDLGLPKDDSVTQLTALLEDSGVPLMDVDNGQWLTRLLVEACEKTQSSDALSEVANLIKDVLLHESRDEDDDDDDNIENVTLPFTLNDADDVSCSTAHGADVITTTCDAVTSFSELALDTSCAGSVISATSCSTDDVDMDMRAPYIPMSGDEDNIFGLSAASLAAAPLAAGDSTTTTTTAKCQAGAVGTTESIFAPKQQATVGADDTGYDVATCERQRPPLVKQKHVPYVIWNAVAEKKRRHEEQQQQQQQVSRPPPSKKMRTESEDEAFYSRPSSCASDFSAAAASRQPSCDGVLKNLLVTGADPMCGYDITEVSPKLRRQSSTSLPESPNSTLRNLLTGAVEPASPPCTSVVNVKCLPGATVQRAPVARTVTAAKRAAHNTGCGKVEPAQVYVLSSSVDTINGDSNTLSRNTDNADSFPAQAASRDVNAGLSRKGGAAPVATTSSQPSFKRITLRTVDTAPVKNGSQIVLTDDIIRALITHGKAEVILYE